MNKSVSALGALFLGLLVVLFAFMVFALVVEAQEAWEIEIELSPFAQAEIYQMSQAGTTELKKKLPCENPVIANIVTPNGFGKVKMRILAVCKGGKVEPIKKKLASKEK